MSINVYIPPEMREILHGRDDAKIKIKIGDYITDDFLRKYTKFKDFAEFIEYSPYTDDELTADLKLFESDKMNRYIELTTQFKNFSKMVGCAFRDKLENHYKRKENKYE